MRSVSISVLLTVFTSITFGSDVLRTYQVFSYPKRLATCDAESRALSEKFATLTNAKVIEATAKDEKENACNLSVVYTNSPPLSLVTTVMEDVHRGTYATLKDCNENLEAETDLFERSAGIRSVVAYCHDDRDPTNRLPIVLRIEGFGTPEKPPQIDQHPLTGVRLVEDIGPKIAEMKNLILQEGIALAQLVYRKEGDLFSSFIARYYGKKRAPFLFRRVGKFLSVENCMSTKRELETIFSEKAPGTLGFFCGEDAINSRNVELFIYRLETETSLVHSKYPKEYAKYALCQADRTRILEIYKTELKRPAFATLCETAPDGYAIRVFEIYPQ